MTSLFSWNKPKPQRGGTSNSFADEEAAWSLPRDHYQDPYAQTSQHMRADSGSNTSFPPASSYTTSNDIPPSPGLTSTSTFELPTSPSTQPATHPSSSHSYYRSNYPSVRTTFQRLRKILRPAYPELLDTLNNPLPPADLTAMQQALTLRNPVTLPDDVKEYFSLHDGQDTFSISSSDVAEHFGLLFGLWLMTADQVVAEWQILRRMEARLRSGQQAVVDDPFAQYYRQSQTDSSTQSSCPPSWVHPVFSHPGWIPLARDYAGNYIGIDLDPPDSLRTPIASPNPNFGPSLAQSQTSATIPSGGRSGQVIAFGREMDRKTVLYPGYGSNDAASSGGWARFLSSFVDDLDSGEFSTLEDLITSQPTVRIDQRDGSRDQDEDDDDSSSVHSRESDGIGSLGYFEATRSDTTMYSGSQERTGKRQTSSAPSSAVRWRLKPPYKNLGTIEALCKRAERQWQDLGVIARQPSTSRASSRRSSSRLDQADGQLPASPNLVLSPASPVQQRFSSSPRQSLDSQRSTTSSAKGKARVSFDQESSQAEATRVAKRRANQPPPMAVALPTLEDLLLDELNDDHAV